jgi:glycosyltransferase involved in cell wall biosynthesis
VSLDNLLVIPLGEASRTEVETAVRRQFDSRLTTWLDRREVRRRPFAIAKHIRSSYDGAVLVAPDLRQPRLRLTSFLLALGRAESRWRIDLRGNREAWTLGGHVARNGVPIIRHVLACVLALVFAEPLLRGLAALIRPRQTIAVRPRRVLYLRSQLWLGLEGGGSVAHTAGVIGGLEQAGTEVRVVSSDRLPGVDAPTTVETPEVWFDGWLREVEDLGYNASFFFAALRASTRYRPEAIYQRHTAFNCAGAILSRILRLPLVLEFNSSEVWKGRYWGGLRLARVAGVVERINLRAADRIIVVSDVLRQDLVERGVPADKVTMNPNAVDPARFTPDAGGGRVREQLDLDGTVVVGFSGTFGEWHGVPTLARAIPLVLEARPHVRWLLIGDGPLRATIGVSGRVRLAGMVPHADVPAYLAACDILVSPHGRQADGGEFFGSPTKLFEYMASGRPIVASSIGQIAEVLRDEHTALLVPPDDADALSAAIVRLVDDACLRTQLGGAAREAAVTRHTWRQNAERVLDCLGSR